MDEYRIEDMFSLPDSDKIKRMLGGDAYYSISSSWELWGPAYAFATFAAFCFAKLEEQESQPIVQIAPASPVELVVQSAPELVVKPVRRRPNEEIATI